MTINYLPSFPLQAPKPLRHGQRRPRAADENVPSVADKARLERGTGRRPQSAPNTSHCPADTSYSELQASTLQNPVPGSFWRIEKILVLKRLFRKWDRTGLHWTHPVLHPNSPIREGEGEERSSSQHTKCPLLGPRWNSRTDCLRQWHLAQSSSEVGIRAANSHWPSGKNNNNKCTTIIEQPGNQTPGVPGLFSAWDYSSAEPEPLVKSPWFSQRSIHGTGFHQMWQTWGKLCWLPSAIEMWSVLTEISSPLTYSRLASGVMCGPMGTWSCSNWKKRCSVPSSFPVKWF